MKAASGSKSWFADIFNRHYEYIRNYLFYLSGDIKLAEDLVQDVFLQLWENRTHIKDETVGSYLFTIARNCFLKNRRKQKYDLKFRSTFFEHFEHESPEFLLEMKDFDERIQSSIARLPEKCRIVFLMHRMDGISYQEMADNLGVSVKAIEKQMSKALALLRKKLGDKI